MNYDAVLFDNDGVLVTLVEYEVLREAAGETFASLGVDPDPAHVDEMAIGVAPDALAEVCDAYGLDPDEFWPVRDGTASRAQRAEIRAGRKALYDDFDAVRSIDAPLGIVSSNQQETVDFVLDHFGIGDLFGTAYGREPTVESLRRKKPAAHYLERALSDLDTETALFVGDSETDVLAAENAGIDSAFIRRSHRADLRLDAEPTYEIDGLDELLRVDGVRSTVDAAAIESDRSRPGGGVEPAGGDA
ncbi:HAD family hydrolase [Halegenticoccus tardaugens]|uniref:HAD family hydrolase n=1 Tax=Halegenticoccus tardaugens TaxID=2071624 RepID=UPI00100BA2C8|nr:HAD family hydrolase [Halegenticoccus tardaugens]